MASDGEAVDTDEADMLPDEEAVIAERMESLADSETEYLSAEEIAEELGIELE